jgi:hypothetical protein
MGMNHVDDTGVERGLLRTQATLGARIWNAANVRASGPALHAVMQWIDSPVCHHAASGCWTSWSGLPFILPALQLRCTWIGRRARCRER